jgi:maltose alpha-D-glucosyltransferase/alpha-amylase
MDLKSKDWFKDAIFYEVYIRAYHDSSGDGNGDIRGLIEKLDHIKDLGVDCIWVMPHYPSPLKDDGYDISDYYGVHPDFGSLEDFKALIDAAHARGLKIITDLVLNHTSDQHHWFKEARISKQSPYRDYYVWSDTDERYQEARIIFLDTEPSNWSWDEGSQQYYWHRFYSSQPDLNYDNPEVEKEMIRVADFWLEMGMDGFRADAVPYLYEREGTNCENLPETHVFLKKLRKFMEERYPGTIILSEANQWPEDVRPYFGEGDEVHMNFHFPLMPRVFMALKSEDVTPIKDILARTPQIPENSQWCTFLRNHDELTLEMVTEDERHWMWENYAPQPRMRLNLGIRRRLAPLLDNQLRKILLANSLLLTLPGSPVIYYGDEIGMGDNIWLQDRDGVRTPMQWDGSPNAGFSGAPSDRFYAPLVDDREFGYQKVNVANQSQDPGSLYSNIKQMLATRKNYPAFGRGTFRWIEELVQPALAGFWREYEANRLLVLHNLSNQPQVADLSETIGAGGKPVSILTGERIDALRITLSPFQFLWLEV